MTRESLAIDINADLGEGFPNDAKLLTLVSSTAMACGSHAGDKDVVRASLKVAKKEGVAVGAHPGYADRKGFGRVNQSLTSKEVTQLVVDQIDWLQRLCDEADLPLRFVKPHGALYNQAQKEEAIAEGVLEGVRLRKLPLLGQPGTLLETLAGLASLPYLTEGFPDRRYEPKGGLVPRSRPDALLETQVEVEAQVARLARQRIQTLCIHGDAHNAVANAETVRKGLIEAGFSVRFWG